MVKGLLFFCCAALFTGFVVTVGLVATRTRKAKQGDATLDDDVSLQEMAN